MVKQKPVPKHCLSGLSLILYIEDSEYLPGVSENKGAAISIHAYGTKTFPEINGLGLRPGETTFIALKQVYLIKIDLFVTLFAYFMPHNRATASL